MPGKAGYPYKEAALAHADDHVDADGAKVLDWAQAQAGARAWAAKQTGAGPLSVTKACERYVADLCARKGAQAAKGAEQKIKKHVKRVLGAKLVADLTADDLRSWQTGMVRGEDDEARRRRSAIVRTGFSVS